MFATKGSTDPSAALPRGKPEPRVTPLTALALLLVGLGLAVPVPRQVGILFFGPGAANPGIYPLRSGEDRSAARLPVFVGAFPFVADLVLLLLTLAWVPWRS